MISVKKITTITAVVSLLLVFFTPIPNSGAADDIKIKDGSVTKITKPDNISKTTDDALLTNILNVVYSVIGMIAVLIIVICGIMITTSDGDSQKVATARRGIIYALVGLLIVVSAFIITGVIQNLGGLE